MSKSSLCFGTEWYILLQRGLTVAPARCWAALFGVGCLRVRDAKAICLCVSRATSRYVCFMSRQAARSQRPPPPIAGVVQTKYLQNLCLIGRAWTNFPSFCSTFWRNPSKNVPQVWSTCPSGASAPDFFVEFPYFAGTLLFREKRIFFSISQKIIPMTV